MTDPLLKYEEKWKNFVEAGLEEACGMGIRPIELTRALNSDSTVTYRFRIETNAGIPQIAFAVTFDEEMACVQPLDLGTFFIQTKLVKEGYTLKKSVQLDDGSFEDQWEAPSGKPAISPEVRAAEIAAYVEAELDRASKQHCFTPGDLVQLKSGSVGLLVQELLLEEGQPLKVLCSWLDDDCVEHSEYYHATSLQPFCAELHQAWLQQCADGHEAGRLATNEIEEESPGEGEEGGNLPGSSWSDSNQ